MTTRKTNPTQHRQLARYSVTSDSGRKYAVSCVEAGFVFSTCQLQVKWECSCMGWTRHMPRKDCKHIRHVRTMLND